MKTKTILKTIGWFIGWVVSFQLIEVAPYLMNQPNSMAFTVGVVCFLLNSISIFGCACNFVETAAQLVTEYRESKNKQKQLNN